MSEDRFNFPIKQYMQQLVRENYPEYNTQAGSALHDLDITVMSLMAQNVIDRLNIVKQSSYLTNYPVMTSEDMDKLAANFFIERRTGVKAYGVIRVYFTNKRYVSLTSNSFFYQDTLQWFPITPQDYPIERIQFDASTTEFYIDVAVEASNEGEEYTLAYGDEVYIDGINAARALALYDFVQGTNQDTNATLFERIKDSISNNELVKPSAIRKIMLEQFSTIRNIQVIGYGDPGMERDIVSVSLPLEDMFGVNQCKKVRLPLDANGDVNWYDSTGAIVVAPEGGWVGAIYDLNGKDFANLQVTYDGVNYTTVAVIPGYIVRLLETGAVSDPDQGDHYVARLETVPIIPGGTAIQVLRLDTLLLDIIGASYNYKLIGSVGVNSFHVGGKVDLAIDDLSNEEMTVIVDRADELDPAGSNVIEIPLTSDQVLHADGSIMFEENIAFVSPVLTIIQVDQIPDGVSSSIMRTLVPFRDYTVIRAAHRAKYTTAVYDVLRINATDTVAGVTLNPYVGQRLKITYLANRQLSVMQEFLDSPDNKTADIDVVYPKYIFFDCVVTFSGDDLDVETATQLIQDYVKSISFGASITASEITQLLVMSGATYVKQPIELKATRLNDNGSYEDLTSYDKITVSSNEILYPVNIFSYITKE